jgi:hypothetical protein
VAKSVLERLAESVIGEAFRMRITWASVFDDADTEPNGIRYFRVLHLPLKDRKAFGMSVRSNNIELFGFTLGEVAHEIDSIFNIHKTKSIILIFTIQV